MTSEVRAEIPAGATDAAVLLQRADLLYCLARAFLPPPAGWTVCNWAQPLAEDLAELGTALALDIAEVQAAFAAECERWAAAARRSDESADDWLVEYTRLFLVPPVRVALNAGIYLEGTLGGVSSRMIASCYEVAGFAPDEQFRDLPDHVSMQLEFVARLEERAARGDAEAAGMAKEFCGEFMHAWSEPLEQACRAAGALLPAALVYAALVRLLRRAVDDPGLTSE